MVMNTGSAGVVFALNRFTVFMRLAFDIQDARIVVDTWLLKNGWVV